MAGRWAEAEWFLRAAVTLRREQARDSVHALADALNPLAHLLWLRGNRSAAESLYREALALYRDSLGETHPTAVNTYLELARLLHDRGDSSAEAVSRQGLALARRVVGEHHPSSVRQMTLLAEILTDRGKLAPAESLYRASLAILRRTEPSGGQLTGLVLSGLGRVVLERGDPVRAELHLREALDLYEGRRMPPWQFGHVLEDLGRSLTSQRRYGEAESLLLRSLTARSAAWGESHPWTLRSIRSLAALYEAWAKPELARTYRVRLGDEARPR